MVREFYANAMIRKNSYGIRPDSRSSMFRGNCILYTDDQVREYLQVLTPRREVTVLGVDHISYHSLMASIPYGEILVEIAVPGAAWVFTEHRNGTIEYRFIPRALLTPLARVWAHFLQDTVVPSSNKTEIRAELALCIFCLIKGYPIDVPRIVAWRIHQVVNIKQRKKGLRMPYPNLITGMIHHQLRLEEPMIELEVKLSPLFTILKAQDVYQKQTSDSEVTWPAWRLERSWHPDLELTLGPELHERREHRRIFLSMPWTLWLAWDASLPGWIICIIMWICFGQLVVMRRLTIGRIFR
ncbi:uncharacterized protein LOC130739995 [Lotus japonicus]|uniref:uncharacterized protein LOC130739995 n=1 Tax=Lotus japonicus TaxID=34305 RepID=UPI002587D352|nr:uncharacterized protein LOC130739995 [Lotus japonicus]